ncbi:methionyl-tRNA formyltransferase [Opitutales bacterium ASA1]|uniref:methionyl-tRNA formyltransferase n=1 Tax=Congregicoccus parvus TaxID=3081749 RepID=UPI002B2E49BA|nr:methionyl-tRNA formyltransferase [Opitutales bacterium ASA1]
MATRLIFMGSDAIALPALEWIVGEGHDTAELVAVYTQPDRPHGRGQKALPNAIKTWALARGLPVLQPERLGAEAFAQFTALAPDAVLVMAYGHILRQQWIDAPRFSIWNLHASLLPRYRGASPIQGAIVNGDDASGVCLMRIVRELDAGPVLDRESVPIEPCDTGADLEAKLAACCVPLLRRSLSRALVSEPAVVEQEHAAATFTRRLRKEDGRIDWTAPAAIVARRINGLFPWPSVAIELAGTSVRVGLAEVEQTAEPMPGVAGEVLPASGGGVDALRVRAGDGGVVRLLRLQRPGGRMLPAAEFLRGLPVAAGSVIPSAPMPELVAAQPWKG